MDYWTDVSNVVQASATGREYDRQLRVKAAARAFDSAGATLEDQGGDDVESPEEEAKERAAHLLWTAVGKAANLVAAGTGEQIRHCEKVVRPLLNSQISEAHVDLRRQGKIVDLIKDKVQEWRSWERRKAYADRCVSAQEGAVAVEIGGGEVGGSMGRAEQEGRGEDASSAAGSVEDVSFPGGEAGTSGNEGVLGGTPKTTQEEEKLPVARHRPSDGENVVVIGEGGRPKSFAFGRKGGSKQLGKVPEPVDPSVFLELSDETRFKWLKELFKLWQVASKVEESSWLLLVSVVGDEGENKVGLASVFDPIKMIRVP